jgi:NAD(P)-dependent dehydrogenase (short-subunit alcohol dehydrogenase family)
VVLITGAAAGIGAGCARVFLDEGALLLLLDRDAAALDRWIADLPEDRRSRVLPLVCDVADEALLRGAISHGVAHWGRLDCLINNAGIHPPALTIGETSLELLDEVFHINFRATFIASQAVVESLKSTRGTIINISSMTALLGQENSTAYAASKGAQVSFTKSLALELARFGVRVNAILPSNVDTPLMRTWASSLPDPAAALERVARLQPLGRMAAPEEIGRVALFLATEDSSFLTGQAIEADGGAALDY